MATRTPLYLDQPLARIAEVPVGDTLDTALLPSLLGRSVAINGDFSMWQRGTEFGASGYSADRWYFNAGGGVTSPFLRQNPIPLGAYNTLCPNWAWVSYTGSASASHYVVLEQRIEDVRTFAGNTVVVTFLVFNAGAAGRKIAVEFGQNFGGSGGSPSTSGIGAATYTLAAGVNAITHVVQIPSISGKTLGTTHTGYLILTLWASGGSDFNARNASLGPQTGDVHFAQVQIERAAATPFQRRLPAVEMMLCQRYYEKSYDLSSAPGAAANPGREAHAMSGVLASTCWATVRFTQRKRSVPSIVVYPANSTGGSPGNVAQNDGSLVPATVENVGSSGMQVAWGNSSGKFGGWFHWTADAEI
ncbi:TPA: hypothetical protein UMI76_000346 [Stenotrophomonas maltophilia]|nr:hypothetical protein [Stenotrophomonas maltophilia]